MAKTQECLKIEKICIPNEHFIAFLWQWLFFTDQNDGSYRTFKPILGKSGT